MSRRPGFTAQDAIEAVMHHQGPMARRDVLAILKDLTVSLVDAQRAEEQAEEEAARTRDGAQTPEHRLTWTAEAAGHRGRGHAFGEVLGDITPLLQLGFYARDHELMELAEDREAREATAAGGAVRTASTALSGAVRATRPDQAVGLNESFTEAVITVLRSGSHRDLDDLRRAITDFATSDPLDPAPLAPDLTATASHLLALVSVPRLSNGRGSFSTVVSAMGPDARSTLILFALDPTRTWTSTQVAAGIGTGEAAAMGALLTLDAGGLIEPADDGPRTSGWILVGHRPPAS